MIKKLSKSKIENLVWTLWDSYESGGEDGDLTLPVWGSCSSDDEQKTEDLVTELVTKKFPIPEEIVRSVLRSIYHVRECVMYDEREVNEYVEEWSEKFYHTQGKGGGQKEYDLLKKTVEGCVKTYDTSWDDRSGEPLVDGKRVNTPEYEKYFKDVVRPKLKSIKKWENTQKKILGKIGVPESEVYCLLTFCKLSKIDEPEFKVRREETYERLLQECKHFVK
jgi:hypothetical protein